MENPVLVTWTVPKFDRITSIFDEEISKSSAIASIPKDGKVQKAPKTQMVALLCIFLSSLSRYANGALL